MSDLPENWVSCSVADVTIPVSMVDAGRAEDREISYIDISCIDNITNKIDNPKQLRLSSAPSRARQLVQTGDVLFATVRPYLRNIAQVPASLDGEVASTGFAVLRPAKGVVPNYLFYKAISRRFVASLSGEQYGVSYPAVKDDQVRAQPFELPPTNEQLRIVAKVDELFSEIGKGLEDLKTAKKKLAAYRQAILKCAFEGKLSETWRLANPGSAKLILGDIQKERQQRKPRRRQGRAALESDSRSRGPRVPKEWAINQLGNLNVEVFDGPFGSNLKTADYVEAGVRVIRLENIGWGEFLDDKRSFVSKTKYRAIRKHTVTPGDIVFSSFVTDAIRSTLIPSHIRFAVNKADCFAIRFFGKTVDAKFVQFFLQSRNVYKQVESMIHGVGRPRINTSQLKEIVIPICSPAEQALIVETLEAAFSAIASLEATIEAASIQLSALYESILIQAFSGRLVSQDPEDEPASLLLNRIRAQQKQISSKNRRSSRDDSEEAA